MSGKCNGESDYVERICIINRFKYNLFGKTNFKNEIWGGFISLKSRWNGQHYEITLKLK